MQMMNIENCFDRTVISTPTARGKEAPSYGSHAAGGRRRGRLAHELVARPGLRLWILWGYAMRGFWRLPVGLRLYSAAAPTGLLRVDKLSPRMGAVPVKWRAATRFTQPTSALRPLFPIRGDRAAVVASPAIKPDGTLMAGGAIRLLQHTPV